MRTYEFQGLNAGGLENLKMVERARPRPGPGQVLVRMRATSLNYRDWLVATGRYGRGPTKVPLVPLSDGAGEVSEVGPGVTTLVPGDRVASAFFQKWVDGPPSSATNASALGGAIDGVLAEEVVLEEAGAVKFPAAFSFEEAATLPCAAVTVWVALMAPGSLRAGETVLAMGTGGVSIFALQMAKAAGARVMLTSSSDAKLERGRALGADMLVNYKTTPDWPARARELTAGNGVDHLLEVGGAGTLPFSLRAVREGGHLTLVGLLTGAIADRDAARRNDRGVRVDAVYVGSVRHFDAMNAFIDRSGMRPVIDRTFAFEEAKDAYAYLESGAHFGKIVIRV